VCLCVYLLTYSSFEAVKKNKKLIVAMVDGHHVNPNQDEM
jgi:hypothetical protein